MKRKSVLEMSNGEAKKFFLDGRSYCDIDLPNYFTFDKLLTSIDNELSILERKEEKPSWYDEKKLRESTGINHTILTNKDGKLSWRPLQIIHPILYVKLVREITKDENWKWLLSRFEKFRSSDRVKCVSIPVKSEGKKANKAVQIRQWWEEVEQESIILSLQYKYLYNSDIADCYSSFYTHSIAWAIETKEEAKKKRDESLLGNRVDKSISNMQNAQTNGIPQGSVLMDFIAELILGYIDELLFEKLDSDSLTDYKILRYRDDYKIFVNSQNDGELILKRLAEVLIPFGLKLNSSKTNQSKNVIMGAIKSDKLAWIRLNYADLNMQQKLLLIHQHSTEFPNSGSVVRRLTELSEQMDYIRSKQNWGDSIQLISITVDIITRNPKAIPCGCSIISKVLRNITGETKSRIRGMICARLMDMPNSEFSQIWLQRILKGNAPKKCFSEKLCQLANGEEVSIWENDWLKESGNTLAEIMSSTHIFDKKQFDEADEVINSREISVFVY